MNPQLIRVLSRIVCPTITFVLVLQGPVGGDSEPVGRGGGALHLPGQQQPRHQLQGHRHTDQAAQETLYYYYYNYYYYYYYHYYNHHCPGCTAAGLWAVPRV